MAWMLPTTTTRPPRAAMRIRAGKACGGARGLESDVRPAAPGEGEHGRAPRPRGRGRWRPPRRGPRCAGPAPGATRRGRSPPPGAPRRRGPAAPGAAPPRPGPPRRSSPPAGRPPCGSRAGPPPPARRRRRASSLTPSGDGEGEVRAPLRGLARPRRAGCRRAGSRSSRTWLACRPPVTTRSPGASPLTAGPTASHHARRWSSRGAPASAPDWPRARRPSRLEISVPALTRVRVRRRRTWWGPGSGSTKSSRATSRGPVKTIPRAVVGTALLPGCARATLRLGAQREYCTPMCVSQGGRGLRPQGKLLSPNWNRDAKDDSQRGAWGRSTQKKGSLLSPNGERDTKDGRAACATLRGRWCKGAWAHRPRGRAGQPQAGLPETAGGTWWSPMPSGWSCS